SSSSLVTFIVFSFLWGVFHELAVFHWFSTESEVLFSFRLTMPLRSVDVTPLHRYYGLLPIWILHWLRYASLSRCSHVALNLVFFHPCRCPFYSGRCDTSVAVN